MWPAPLGSCGSKATLWHCDTQAVEDLNLAFASRLPSHVVLKGAGPILVSDPNPFRLAFAKPYTDRLVKPLEDF